MNNYFFIILGLIVSGLFYLLAPILTPFLVGAILAYLGDPLVRLLMKLKISRLLSAIIVFFIIFSLIILLVVLLIPLIEKQIVTLMNFIPNVLVWAQNTLFPMLKDYFGIDELVNIDTIKATIAENWTKAGGVASWAFKSVVNSGFALFEWIANLVLVPVVTFYLLRDWHKLIHGIKDLLPRKIEPTVIKLASQCDSVLSAFFRGQLFVMISLGLIYGVGLTLVGLHVGLIIGLIAGLLCIVPYLGFIFGVLAASIAAFVQFGTFTSLALVWVVFVIGQLIEGTLLTPNLVGDRIGLHPVAVIFSILAGGSLFGFFGVLLALPVAAVIMVLIRYAHERYRNSHLYR